MSSGSGADLGFINRRGTASAGGGAPAQRAGGAPLGTPGPVPPRGMPRGGRGGGSAAGFSRGGSVSASVGAGVGAGGGRGRGGSSGPPGPGLSRDGGGYGSFAGRGGSAPRGFPGGTAPWPSPAARGYYSEYSDYGSDARGAWTGAPPPTPPQPPHIPPRLSPQEGDALQPVAPANDIDLRRELERMQTQLDTVRNEAFTFYGLAQVDAPVYTAAPKVEQSAPADPPVAFVGAGKWLRLSYPLLKHNRKMANGNTRIDTWYKAWTLDSKTGATASALWVRDVVISDAGAESETFARFEFYPS